MPKTYTVKEVANILGFSTNSIYSFLKTKRIKGVRVGKGRFRIPEEELSRVLHLGKPVEKTTATIRTETGTTIPISKQNNLVAVSQEQMASSLLRKHGDQRFARANMFDWLIGLSTLISGVALFLFNQSSGDNTAGIGLYLTAARVMLITVGIGVIISDAYKRMHLWRSIFYILLFFLSVGSAWSLANIQDYDGAILYGSMGLVVALNVVVAIDGIVSYVLYLAFILIGIVVLLLFGGNVPHVQAFQSLFRLPNTFLAAMLAIFGGINLSVLWAGYQKRSTGFWVGSWIIAAIAFGTASWYGILGYWARAMYFVVLGFFSILTPLWDRIINAQETQNRVVVHIFLSIIGSVILASIFGVYVLQQTLWVQKSHEFQNKIALATSTVTNAFQNVQDVLTTTALNQDLVISVDKADLTTINKYAKVLYEGHSYIRRVVVLNSVGRGIALYPYGTFDQENLSFRDYFISVRNYRKPYISSVFQALSDNLHRPVVSLSVPLINAKGDFAGVLSASIDLDRLNVELQRIADQEKQETFVVVDRKGQYVLDPNMRSVGKSINRSDLMWEFLDGKSKKTVQSITYSNLGVVSYNVVPDLGWAIRLSAPIGIIVSINTVLVLTLFGVLAAVLIFSTSVFFLLYIRRFAFGGNAP